MCPHHPFPKSHGKPKSINKLTLDEPAITMPVRAKDIVRVSSYHLPHDKYENVHYQHETVCM